MTPEINDRRPIMTTESTIAEAIARSISHTEIVRVYAADIDAAVTEVAIAADEYDTAEENDGSLDVWGTTDEGDDFRLRLVKA